MGGRALTTLALAVVLVVTGAAKPSPAAAADPGCATHGSDFSTDVFDDLGMLVRQGCARDAGTLRPLAGSDTDWVAAIDFDATQLPAGWREAMVLEVDAIRDEQARGLSLSEAIRVQNQKRSVGLYQAPADDVRFGGTIRVVGNSIVIVTSEPEADNPSTWEGFWRKSLPLIAKLGVGVLVAVACLYRFPKYFEACGTLAGGVGGFTEGAVEAALSHHPWDAELAGQLMASTLFGAIEGGAVGVIIEEGVAGTSLVFGVLSTVLRKLALVFRGFRGTLNYLADLCAGDTTVIREFLDSLARLKRGVSTTDVPLRVMPLGDSITYGAGSSTGAGYRARLHEYMTRSGGRVEFVGSQRSGPAPNAHEGHSGWEIQDITNIVPSVLANYQPNVVLLHIGTNDMNRNVDPGGALARLTKLIDQIFLSAPGVTLLVSTLVPSTNAATQERIDTYNTALLSRVHDLAAVGKRVRSVKMNAVTPFDLVDSLHPNNTGYRKMAVAFYLGVLNASDASTITPPSTGGGGSCPPLGGGWTDRGKIATGGVTMTALDGQVRLADLDGNGQTDYLLLKDNGAVDAWLRTAGGWLRRGQVAPGTGNPSSKVHFADLDGDRDADYLVVQDDGSVEVWRNDEVELNGPGGWSSLGRMAEGTGHPGSKVRFADIDGDVDVDYLIVHSDGAVEGWRNDDVINKNNGGSGLPTPAKGWMSQGRIAEGTGHPGSKVRFADIDGDLDADYLVVHDSGAVDAWRNDDVVDVTDSTGLPPAGGRGWRSRGQIATGTPAGGGSRVQFADADADRDTDYFVVGDGREVSLWQNNNVTVVGGAGWAEKGLYVHDLNVSGKVYFPDLDGDGDADYVVVGPGGVIDGWRNDNVAVVGGSGWQELGRIAAGVPMATSEHVALADYDGDGDDDYLVVDDADGAVRAWRNDGVFIRGGSGWTQVGTIAHGTPDRGEIQFADLDGDGYDDYLVVAGDHSVTAWRNAGTNAPGGAGWTAKGLVARPTVASVNERTMFANLTCDRRAEYVLRDPTRDNMLHAWTNLDGFANRWAEKKKVAWGVPVGYEAEIQLADLSGDGLDDYLIVDPRSGAVTAWLNAGGNQADPE